MDNNDVQKKMGRPKGSKEKRKNYELQFKNIKVWFGTKPAFYRNTVRYYVYLS